MLEKFLKFSLRRVVTVILAVALIMSHAPLFGLSLVTNAEIDDSAENDDPAETSSVLWEYYPSNVYITEPDPNAEPSQENSWRVFNATAEKNAEEGYVSFTADSTVESYFYTGWANGSLTESQIPVIDADAGSAFVLKCRIEDYANVGKNGAITGQIIAGEDASILKIFDYSQTADWQYVIIDMSTDVFSGFWTGEIDFFRIDFANVDSASDMGLMEGFKFDMEYIKLFADVKEATAYALEYIDCLHNDTEVINKCDATCTETGYTGDTYCGDCGMIIDYGEVIPEFDGEHTYKDDSCSTCGASAWQYVVDEGAVTITGCLGLPENLSIPSEIDGYPVTGIGGYAFYYCSTLKTIVIPDTVVTIGSGAFFGCNNLAEVTIPGSVTEIDYYVFGACSGLKKVTFLDGVKGIYYYAFDGCYELTEVMIPDSVVYIDTYAFNNCRSLSSIDVSELNAFYSSVDGVLFNADKSILLKYPASKEGTHYIIPNGVSSIGEAAFTSCRNLRSVSMPGSVETIGYKAFYDCFYLTKVELGESVTNIRGYAFSGCSSLKSIAMPKNISVINDRAFSGCESLKDVYFNGSEEEWTKIVIGENNQFLSDATVYFDCALSLVEGSYIAIDTATNFATNIAVGTKVSDVVSQFDSVEAIAVVNGKGEVLDTDGFIGTGCKVQRIIDNTVVDEVVVVILGDADGDGLISVSDAQVAYNHMIGFTAVDGAYAEAVNVNDGNAMSVLDVMAILNMT